MAIQVSEQLQLSDAIQLSIRLRVKTTPRSIDTLINRPMGFYAALFLPRCTYPICPSSWTTATARESHNALSSSEQQEKTRKQRSDPMHRTGARFSFSYLTDSGLVCLARTLMYTQVKGMIVCIFAVCEVRRGLLNLLFAFSTEFCRL